MHLLFYDQDKEDTKKMQGSCRFLISKFPIFKTIIPDQLTAQLHTPLDAYMAC